MPKQKTHSGTKKRFKMTGGGKIKRKTAYTGHLLTLSKSRAKKRKMRAGAYVSAADEKRIRRLLGKN